MWGEQQPRSIRRRWLLAGHAIALPSQQHQAAWDAVVAALLHPSPGMQVWGVCLAGTAAPGAAIAALGSAPAALAGNAARARLVAWACILLKAGGACRQGKNSTGVVHQKPCLDKNIETGRHRKLRSSCLP